MYLFVHAVEAPTSLVIEREVRGGVEACYPPMLPWGGIILRAVPRESD